MTEDDNEEKKGGGGRMVVVVCVGVQQLLTYVTNERVQQMRGKYHHVRCMKMTDQLQSISNYPLVSPLLILQQ